MNTLKKNNKPDYPIGLKNLSLFLRHTYGNADIIGVAKNVTTDIPALMNMLSDTLPTYH